jgi:hemoglobin
MKAFVRSFVFAVTAIGAVGVVAADDMKKDATMKKAPDAAKDAKKAPDKPADKAAEKKLYDRLGGEAAIKAVVHEFVGNVVADKRINKFFAKADGKKLEALLVDQVGEATGGPQKYKGKNMKDAHKGMKITEADFNALVEDLVKALDKFKVPEKEKGELLGALGGMKGDIVNSK